MFYQLACLYLTTHQDIHIYLVLRICQLIEEELIGKKKFPDRKSAVSGMLQMEQVINRDT